jgi:SPP1 family predicted phage head-tail adaptor
MAVGTGTAGVRTRLVTIQQMTESIGGSGRPVETWTSLARAWMERIDASGDEQFGNASLATRYDTRWLMPYQRNMDPEVQNVPKSRRLQLNGRIYDIISAVPIGLHDRIELRTIAKG